ncbi:hypothetical protein IFM89_017052 [Coptis chinensis]|uniref:valine--tRNA ligase n=1 Tax=Coptis chinensis TaxID=261450 RepID=A0A835LQI0_9MAGN|nr:hypothetical protein IFM89_017052 [Coptis chinensis]
MSRNHGTTGGTNQVIILCGYLTRHDIGRDRFVSEVWKWKNEYGGTILNQQHQLGASLDWSHECFTMDEKRSKAVTEAFVGLYNEAISDIEVDHVDIKPRTMREVPGYEDPVEFGVMELLAYPLEGDVGEIVVATTRVETMLGDTAIAIHPEDDKHTKFHGKFAIHPFNGRKLKIICDTLVDKDLGTGAVKITPAHDPNDFEYGKRHNLEFISIFTDDGKINSNGGYEFEGMPRFKARTAMIEALKKKGLHRGVKNNEMSLAVCSRSNDVVEPMIKPQWFVNCALMAKEALDAVVDDENKKIEIIPKKYAADWKRFRHIPFYLADIFWYLHHMLDSGNCFLDSCYPTPKTSCHGYYSYGWRIFGIGVSHDSSGGATAFQHDNTEELKVFYPTSVLETGHDIIFFWVFRMVMLGMKLGGDIPFKKLHPDCISLRFIPLRIFAFSQPLEVQNQSEITLVELAKSWINCIWLLDKEEDLWIRWGLQKWLEEGNLDPSELVDAKREQAVEFPDGIAECGADALRFALVITQLRWILSVLNKAIFETVSSLDSYEFAKAANAVYSWWFQLCDTFIEVIKPYFSRADPKFNSSRSAVCDTLWISLDSGLCLLHPFMPFVTEELWQRLPMSSGNYSKESIMISKYPSVTQKWTNNRIEYEMGLVEVIIKMLRSRQSQLSSDVTHESVLLCITDPKDNKLLQILGEYDRLAECGSKFLNENITVYLELQGGLNEEGELEKLRKGKENQK